MSFAGEISQHLWPIFPGRQCSLPIFSTLHEFCAMQKMNINYKRVHKSTEIHDFSHNSHIQVPHTFSPYSLFTHNSRISFTEKWDEKDVCYLHLRCVTLTWLITRMAHWSLSDAWKTDTLLLWIIESRKIDETTNYHKIDHLVPKHLEGVIYFKSCSIKSSRMKLWQGE